MRSSAFSCLALFLATACPIICRASTAVEGHSADETASAYGPTAGQCDGCTEERSVPSTPTDPCYELSCFCSPYVLMEQGTDATDVHTMGVLSIVACPSIIILMPTLAINDGLAEWPISPVITAEASAALPLQI